MRRHYCVDLQFGRSSDCIVYYVQLDDLGVAIYARSRAGRVIDLMNENTIICMDTSDGVPRMSGFRLSAAVPPKFPPLNLTMQSRQQDFIPYIYSSRNCSP
jgi:hypothetical protein